MMWKVLENSFYGQVQSLLLFVLYSHSDCLGDTSEFLSETLGHHDCQDLVQCNLGVSCQYFGIEHFKEACVS